MLILWNPKANSVPFDTYKHIFFKYYSTKLLLSQKLWELCFYMLLYVALVFSKCMYKQLHNKHII